MRPPPCWRPCTRHGRTAGNNCDISLFDTALAMLSYLGTWHLTVGHAPARTEHSAHRSLVPFQVFETADSWIVVAAPEEKFFRRFATALGRPDLTTDPRFTDFAARARHRDALLEHLVPAFRTKTAARWTEILTAGGVPCGTVQTVEPAMNDPQALARKSVVEVDHPRWGRSGKWRHRCDWPAIPSARCAVRSAVSTQLRCCRS